MNDPKTLIKDSDEAMSLLSEQQSALAHDQALRAMRQSRFLFYCSLVLVVAMVFLTASDLFSNQNRAPSISILVVVGVAFAVTGQRYSKAKQTLKQNRGPAA